MKARLLGTLVATLAMAASSGVATAAPARATLVDVDVIQAARTPARPGGTANCSNAGAETGAYVVTGWAVQGPKTALFNTTTTLRVTPSRNNTTVSERPIFSSVSILSAHANPSSR